MVQAKDGIYMRFAEYATINAGTIISAQTIMHSNINCLGAVEVLDGRGSIIGGTVCAGTYIAARLLGNPSGRGTELRVGISPYARAQLAELESKAAALKKVVDRLKTILRETPDSELKNERERTTRMENVRKLLLANNELEDYGQEIREIRETLEGSQNGEVHVLNTAYPGVNIAIGLSRLLLDETVTYATFKTNEGLVEYGACRFKPTMATRKKKRR
jgi:uncharacterized protein (DUF342 family)